MLSFNECTLAKLDREFGLRQARQSRVLDDWLAGDASISDFERQALLTFRDKLDRNVYDWNETELAYNFIGPILAIVDYITERFNFFAERPLNGTVNGVLMGGKPDGMIATGFREPEMPYFCFKEYKREKDPSGDPAAQVLAAMLVAQALNDGRHLLYGSYIKGYNWHFMILQGTEYVISPVYVATRDDIFDIFRVLRVFK